MQTCTAVPLHHRVRAVTRCLPLHTRVGLVLLPVASCPATPVSPSPCTPLPTLFVAHPHFARETPKPQTLTEITPTAALTRGRIGNIGHGSKSCRNRSAYLGPARCVYRGQRRSRTWQSHRASPPKPHPYQKFFDLMPQSIVFEVCTRLGWDAEVVAALQAMYCQLVRAFKLAGGLGDRWRATNGILQGCPLSVILVQKLREQHPPLL